jgi:hypothetical protein
MNNRRISEIQARIENCTNEEINTVIDMIKNRRSQLSLVAGSKFSVGQKVQFTGKGLTIEGKLTKINQTTAIVADNMSSRQWKVSISLLEAA